MIEIGTKLKELRQELGLSQTAFATSIGVTQDSISLWEQNKRIPDTVYIVEICKKYKISADYLLGLDENKF